MIIKKISEIKFAYLANDTAKTSTKNHMYHYITRCKMIICDRDGMTDTNKSNTNFFNTLSANVIKNFEL
jgi:hypothetical protein